MPLNVGFLLHLVLVALSVYAVVGLVTRTEGKATRICLGGGVPKRSAGGILTGLGVLFGLRVLGVLGGSIASLAPLAETELALSAAASRPPTVLVEYG